MGKVDDDEPGARTDDAAVTLTVLGALDAASAEKLRCAIVGALDLGRPVELDLAGVTNVDRAGLDMLAGLQRAWPEQFRIGRTSRIVDRAARSTPLRGLTT